MSLRLTSSLRGRSARWHIAKLDEESENSHTSQEFLASRGPFGVFKVRGIDLNQTSPVATTAPVASSVEAVNRRENDHSLPVEHVLPSETLLPFTPLSQALIESSCEMLDETQAPDLSVDDWTCLTMDPNSWLFDGDLTFDTSLFPSMPCDFATVMPPSEDATAILIMESGRRSPNILIESLPNTSRVPDDAVFLVKIFASAILKQLTPYRHSKTPWHVLFIPFAKQTLAALTLSEDLDHASLCAFYGMLAISALSLQGTSKAQIWSEKGTTYKRLCREHVRGMLRTAYETAKRSKYKSISMALLVTIHVSMFSGNLEQVECYLLETEKFIRLRGLNRNKSRKVRLLHHCYVYERLFHESTILYNIESTNRDHVRRTVESSGLVVQGQDSLTFRLPTWENLDRDMLAVKGQEEGENDMHLERPGSWAATLYPEIFGVPESWLTLLSFVIRLGKEKDACEARTAINALSLPDFWARAKALERCIGKLQIPGRDDLQDKEPILQSLLEATRNTIMIYFYRRIRDISASLLQDKVKAVQRSLCHGDQTDGRPNSCFARFIWPAFIAACEAEGQELQASFSIWFKSSEEQSGLSVFTKTLGNIERIWDEKRRCTDSTITWIDMMRDAGDTRPVSEP